MRSASSKIGAASRAADGTITSDFCQSNSLGYIAIVPLKSGGAWCIDSSNISRSTNAAGNAYSGVTALPNPAVDNDPDDVTCN